MTTAYAATIALRTLLKQEAWNEVQTFSARTLGFGYGEYRMIQSKAGALETHKGDLERLSTNLGPWFDQISALPDRGRTRAIAQARAALQTRYGDPLPDQINRVLTQLAVCDPAFLADIAQQSNGLAASTGEDRQSKTDLAIAQMVYGLLGLFHAAFNSTYATLAANSYDLIRASKMTIADRSHDLENALRSKQHALYDAIVARQAPRDLAIVAESMASMIELSLLPFAAHLADANLAARTLLQHGNSREALRLGQESLHGGMLAREAIASFAASYAFAATCLNPLHKHSSSGVGSISSSTAFDQPLPTSPLVSISDVPELADGQQVSIEGFVSAIQVIRSADGKLLSRIEMLDPLSQTRTYAAGVYTHFAHIGLCKGVFCRLSGTYRQRSKLFPDRPLIEVQRMPLATLSKRSWRLRFLQSAQPWFRLFPNSHNLSWAIGPQRRPRQPGETAYSGAGELLYPPVVRNH